MTLKPVTWRFAGPANAQAVFTLPVRNFGYRVMAVTIRYRWDVAIPAYIAPVLTLVTDGVPSYVATTEKFGGTGLLGVTGNVAILTFSAAPAMVGFSAPPETVGGIVRAPSAIMPELWVMPQDSLQLEIGQANTGDVWLDTSVMVGMQ